MQQPLRELQLGVQPGAGAESGIRRPWRALRVRGVHVVGRRRRRGEPAQIDRGIREREAVPLEHPDHLGPGLVIVTEEEAVGTGPAENDGRLEPPQSVGVGRPAPAVHEGCRHPVGRRDPIQQSRQIVAQLFARAHRQPLAAQHGRRQGVDRGERGADRRRSARPGRQVRRIDAVAGHEVHDGRAQVSELDLAQQLRHPEGQDRAHARRERAQRAHLRGQLHGGILVLGHADDDLSSIVQLCHRRVVASRRSLGERTDPDDADPGQSRRHRRG